MCQLEAVAADPVGVAEAGGVYVAAASARCSSLTERSGVLGWRTSFAAMTGVLGRSSFTACWGAPPSRRAGVFLLRGDE
jgi:hypothetical protein